MTTTATDPDLLPQHDESQLAPKFRAAVDRAIAAARAAGFDVFVYEALRSEKLQEHYYATGASHAQTAKFSWHFYGLAVDVISESKLWDRPDAWWEQVSTFFKAEGLHWGGDWHSFKDLPHFQWGSMAESPHDAPRIYDNAGGGEPGRRAVWAAVGAD